MFYILIITNHQTPSVTKPEIITQFGRPLSLTSKKYCDLCSLNQLLGGARPNANSLPTIWTASMSGAGAQSESRLRNCRVADSHTQIHERVNNSIDKYHDCLSFSDWLLWTFRDIDTSKQALKWFKMYSRNMAKLYRSTETNRLLQIHAASSDTCIAIGYVNCIPDTNGSKCLGFWIFRMLNI